MAKYNINVVTARGTVIDVTQESDKSLSDLKDVVSRTYPGHKKVKVSRDWGVIAGFKKLLSDIF